MQEAPDVHPVLRGRSKINIRAIQEMILANIQAGHQIARDGHSFFQPLIVTEDDFQFHEIAEILDAIEMNPGLPDQVKPAGFSDDSALAVNQGQHCPGGGWIGDGNAEIIGFPGPR